jgi:hypothetical protein
MVETRIAEPDEAAAASQWPVNKLLHQWTHGPSLGNSPLSTSHNNRGTVGSGVFYAVCAEAV